MQKIVLCKTLPQKKERQYIGIPGLFYDIIGAYIITIYTVQNM